MIANLLRFFAAVPALTIALTHAGTCPACWPLIGGLVSSLGLTFTCRNPVSASAHDRMPRDGHRCAGLRCTTRLPAVDCGGCSSWRNLDWEIHPRHKSGYACRGLPSCRRVSLEFLAAPTRQGFRPKLLCVHIDRGGRRAREDDEQHSDCLRSKPKTVRRTHGTGQTSRAGGERMSEIASWRRPLFRAGFPPGERTCQTCGPRTGMLPFSHVPNRSVGRQARLAGTHGSASCPRDHPGTHFGDCIE
jgi:hypothetical protein